jgi:transposase
MCNIVIGVDIAKKKFDVASLSDGKYKHKIFTNNEQGFAVFIVWLVTLFPNDKPLICMEATGAYSIPFAEFMVNQGYPVSVVNPAKIKAFGKSELSRAKTDKADAKLIARYAFTMHPPLWTLPPRNIRELQALLRRVEHLLEMSQMEKNRLETADISIVDSINTVLITLETELEATRKAIREHISHDPELKRRRDLLITIPGIGEASAAQLLVVLSEHHGFINAKQVVAFTGLAPSLRQSGKWSGKTKLAKSGDSLLRKALYFPALSAWQHNPLIREGCKRLKANGKNGKAIVCAAMRKLVHLAFGILKSGLPFDPNFLLA